MGAVGLRHYEELAELLSERDRQITALREESRERREEIKALDARIVRVRDILAGKDHVQEEIPGTAKVALKPKAAKPPKRGTSKKFPDGSGLDEPCTACGASYGAHAGDKCPPKPLARFEEDDDEPGRPLVVEDQVEGVTYETKPRPRKRRLA